MKGITGLFFFVFLSTLGFSQPVMSWQKTFGGSKFDIANQLIHTKDGGYVLAGTTSSMDGNVTFNHDTTGLITDFWIVSYDSVFNIQWERSFGGSNYEAARSIVQTFDGGYVVVGNTQSHDGDVTSNHDSSGASTDIWVVKLSSNGAVLWNKSLGGTGSDGARKVIETRDSALVVVGSTNSHDGNVILNHDSLFGTFDAWFVKLDSIGTILWSKCYGGTGSAGEFGRDVVQNSDGKYFFLAGGGSSDGDMIHDGFHGSAVDLDYWILRLDSAGNILADTCLGGSAGETPVAMLQRSDSTIVVGGITSSSDGDVTGFTGTTSFASDIWVMALNLKGDSSFWVNWKTCIGGADSQDAVAGMANTASGGFILTGQNSINGGAVSGNHGLTDMWCMEFDSLNALIWKKSFGGSSDDQGESILINSAGDLIVAGTSGSSDGNLIFNHGLSDIWISKIHYQTTGVQQLLNADKRISVYPNPGTGTFYISLNSEWTNNSQGITLRVNDLLGRSLFGKSSESFGSGFFSIDISGFSSGIYLLQVDNGSEIISSKIIIQ